MVAPRGSSRSICSTVANGCSLSISMHCGPLCAKRASASHFEIDAMVVLPDHLHALWTLPDGDYDFPVRWRLIKIRFSKSIPAEEPLTIARQVRGERGIW